MSTGWTREYCLYDLSSGEEDFIIDCLCDFINLAEAIISSLIFAHSWKLDINDGSTPNLAALKHYIDNSRCVAYLKNRY